MVHYLKYPKYTFIFLILIILISVEVFGQVGIYRIIGDPKIEEINAEPAIGGADIKIRVKNIGDEGGHFTGGGECNNNFRVSASSSNVYISSGGSETFTLEARSSGRYIFGDSEKCGKTITCEITVEDVGSYGKNMDKRTISFMNSCSLCNTEYEGCNNFGQTTCDIVENSVSKCNKNCYYETIQTCDYKCDWKDGVARCISLIEEEQEQAKERRGDILIFLIIYVGIPALIVFLIWKKHKKKRQATKKTTPINKDKVLKSVYCKKCGKKIPSDADFCPNCGTKQ